MIKNWLDVIVVAKITFVDDSLDRLQELIPPDVLPVRLGGTVDGEWPVPGLADG